MTEPKPIVFETKNVWKSYEAASGRLDVLRGIDMTVRENEFVAIMGLSGVGKSTLLNLLGLLDRLSTGEIVFHVDGQGVGTSQLSADETDRLRNSFVGFVFQAFHLLPDLDVVENVMLPAMISRTAGAFRRDRKVLLERAEKLLGRVGLLDRKDHRPRALSGGERQRVAIARALMNEPRLLLCDEPTGNLDTETSEKIHDLFEELSRQYGTTVVVVTHDQNLANRATRTLHMIDGAFVAEGTAPTPAPAPGV
ncbi:MAG: ABC transporter ATP-binding protein [Planctomycetota bacterium]